MPDTTAGVARELPRIRSERDWYGYLTLENFQAIADRIRRLLEDRTYTWVACNEGLGNYRPEVRTGQRASKVEASLLAPDHGHLKVCDSYGVWGMSTSLPTMGDAYALRSHDAAANRGAYLVFESNRFGQQLAIEHFAPAGYRLYWTVAVEPRDDWRELQEHLETGAADAITRADIAHGVDAARELRARAVTLNEVRKQMDAIEANR